MASLVPEPMEKCAVCSASPSSTRLACDQRALCTSGNCRQIELLEISAWPSSASAKTRSHDARVSASLMAAKPARSKVAASTSTMKVLSSGVKR